MEQQYSSPIPDQYPSSSRPDIDLEQMEALADPTLSSEVRERNTPTDTEEKIQKEVMLQREYARIIALYLELEEAIESGDMPDFHRMSVSMPPAINTFIDEVATELMRLSLYASTDKVLIQKELETMIRRHSFEEKIAGVQTQIGASQKRLEHLRTPALDPEMENKQKAEQIVASLKDVIPVIPMSISEQNPPVKREGFWSEVKRKLRGQETRK